jgi:hypothetical protein
MIRCSSPLPEGLDNPVLEKMLELAPCLEPSKEDKGGNNEGESGPPSLPIPTEGMSAFAKEDNQGEESDLLLLRGRKRTASEDPETKASKWEKKSPPEGPASEGAFGAQSPRGDQPSTEL